MKAVEFVNMAGEKISVRIAKAVRFVNTVDANPTVKSLLAEVVKFVNTVDENLRVPFAKVKKLSQEYDLSIPENVEKAKGGNERANNRVAEPLSSLNTDI